MIHEASTRILVLCFLFFSLLFVCIDQTHAQISSTWFDINPSRSNLDEDNPNGASGGRINHLGATSDLSKIYAASEWGGLYTSFNQGLTWVKVNTFAPSATWDVKVDPGNSERVYVTTFFDGRAVNTQSGISISDDSGNTWNAIDISTLNTLNCTNAQRKTEPTGWQIAINPSVPRIIFIGTSCGLARSLDRGTTWDFVDPSPGDNAEQIYAVVAQGRNIVDVIGDNGHFRSQDNGNTWTPVPPIAGPGPVSGNSGPTNSLAISPAENYVLLASNTNNIWESDDGGNTWPTSLTLPLRSGQSNAQGRIPFIKTNQRITSTQFDIWFGDVNLFRATATTPSTTAPGGSPRAPLNAWTNMQEEGHWDVGDILFDPRASSDACPQLFTNDGGVYRNLDVNSPDCQSPSWEQPNITPHATWLWSLDGRQIESGRHAIYYGLQDNGGFGTTNALEGFPPPVPGWNNYECCDVVDIVAQSNLALSVEGAAPPPGRAFPLVLRDPESLEGDEIPNYPSPGLFSPNFSFKSGRDVVLTGGNGTAINLSDGVYFTNNILADPIAWTSLNAPTAANSSVGSIKVANISNSPNIFFHTGNGNPSGQGLVFRSSLVGTTGAPGSNWTQLPLPPSIANVTVYDVDPTDGNRVIISAINTANNFQMWMTPDFGVNWTPLTELDSLMIGNGTYRNRTNQGRRAGTFNIGTYWQPSMVQFNPRDPSTIIAGAVDAGVFLSLNDGDDWQLISNPTNPTSNAPHIPRPLFAYFSPGRFSASTTSFDVWVGTRGAGVMKTVIEVGDRR